MNNSNAGLNIGEELRALVAASKQPGADADALIDQTCSKLLGAVPDKPLVLDGRMVAPVETFGTGQPLPDWQLGAERRDAALDQTIERAKDGNSARDRGTKDRMD